jgi:site-specific DNA recombinase
MLKAVIYTRVSTDRQAEEGTSLQTQRQDCLKKAQEMGAQVVEVIADEGISGGTLAGRPGILKALALIEEGAANVLLCYDLSRLSRSVEHQALIKRRVESAGGRLAFVMGYYSDDEEGELFYTIDGGFKQYEKRVIRRRTMGGRRKQAEAGLQPSRAFSPFGYHIVTKDDVLRGDYPPEVLGRYIVIESQARIVRELFTRLARGASLRSLVGWINAHGMPTQRGGLVWYHSTLYFILTNPVYVGRPAYGRRLCRTDEARLTQGLKPKFYRPAPLSYQVQLSCEPLVEEATWNVCQERLAENRERLSGSHGRKTLLSGMMRCPTCRRAMTSSMNGQYRYYHCKFHKPSKSPMGKCCDKTRHRVDQVDEMLVRDLRHLAHEPERFTDALLTYDAKQREAQQREAGGELERLRRDLADLEGRETATARAQVEALQRGRSADVYDRLLTDIERERKALQARLAALTTRQEALPWDYATEGQRIAEVLHRFEEVLTAPEEDFTTLEKNGVLSSFVKAIWPEGEGYSVELRAASGESVQSFSIVCTPDGPPIVRVSERRQGEQAA